jgi:hypothetical protein
MLNVNELQEEWRRCRNMAGNVLKDVFCFKYKGCPSDLIKSDSFQYSKI